MSTVASVVNLVRSQVYHIERPPLFAVRFRMMQRVARVRQRQHLIHYYLHYQRKAGLFG